MGIGHYRNGSAFGVESGFGMLGHVASSYEGQILTTTDVARSYIYRSLQDRSERAQWVKASLMPLVWLNAGGQRKIWTINADLQICGGDRVAGWQLVCQSVWSAGLVTGISSDFSAIMTEIMGKQWLISCFSDWSKFSGCELSFQGSRIWMGDDLAPPSINRLESFV